MKLVAQKLSRNLGPCGTDLEALQGWILKSGEDSKKLCISVEIFVDWPTNKNPPWAAYCAFISGRLIVLDKNTGVRPVSIGETWIFLFAKCVMKSTGPETTNEFKYGHICARLKAVIDGDVHVI